MQCSRCKLECPTFGNAYNGAVLGGSSDTFCHCCRIILYNRRYEQAPDPLIEADLIRLQRKVMVSRPVIPGTSPASQSLPPDS